MPTTVSIITPARDSGDHLNRCIDSVVSQVFTNWELLIINDHSSDNTCETVRSYIEKEPRISLHDSIGSGVSAARNYGLSQAQGKYIFFLDSDDWLEPGCLSSLADTAEKDNADISQCSFFYSYANGKDIKDSEAVNGSFNGHDEIMNAYFSGMIGKINLACWGKLYKRELIEGLRFDESLTVQEDAFFTFQCCMKASKSICSDSPLYHYFQNPVSTMNRPFDERMMQYFTVLDREYDQLKDNKVISNMILRRKMITALDLTGRIIRDDSGKEHLGTLRDIALDSSDKIGKKISLNTKTKLKLFLLKHFPSVYYGLIRCKK